MKPELHDRIMDDKATELAQKKYTEDGHAGNIYKKAPVRMLRYYECLAEEQIDRIEEKKLQERDKLTDLIADALGEFGHDRCPYCEADISLDKYITENDIENWLDERGG